MLTSFASMAACLQEVTRLRSSRVHCVADLFLHELVQVRAPCSCTPLPAACLGLLALQGDARMQQPSVDHLQKSTSLCCLHREIGFACAHRPLSLKH